MDIYRGSTLLDTSFYDQPEADSFVGLRSPYTPISSSGFGGVGLDTSPCTPASASTSSSMGSERITRSRARAGNRIESSTSLSLASGGKKDSRTRTRARFNNSNSDSDLEPSTTLGKGSESDSTNQRDDNNTNTNAHPNHSETETIASSSHTEDNSSDDEESNEEEEIPVFFGKQTAQEKAYVKALSSKLPPSTPSSSTPAPRNRLGLGPSSTSTSSNILNVDTPLKPRPIIKKRDSKEFHRRRTLGFARKERESVGGASCLDGTKYGSGLGENVGSSSFGPGSSEKRQKKWSGGFYEKDLHTDKFQSTPLSKSNSLLPPPSPLSFPPTTTATINSPLALTQSQSPMPTVEQAVANLSLEDQDQDQELQSEVGSESACGLGRGSLVPQDGEEVEEEKRPASEVGKLEEEEEGLDDTQLNSDNDCGSESKDELEEEEEVEAEDEVVGSVEARQVLVVEEPEQELAVENEEVLDGEESGELAIAHTSSPESLVISREEPATELLPTVDIATQLARLAVEPSGEGVELEISNLLPTEELTPPDEPQGEAALSEANAQATSTELAAAAAAMIVGDQSIGTPSPHSPSSETTTPPQGHLSTSSVNLDSPLPSSRAAPIMLPGKHMRGENYTPSPARMGHLFERDTSASPIAKTLSFEGLAQEQPVPTPLRASGSMTSLERPYVPTLVSAVTPRRLAHLGTSARTPQREKALKAAATPLVGTPSLPNRPLSKLMPPPPFAPPAARILGKSSSLGTSSLVNGKPKSTVIDEKELAARRRAIRQQMDAAMKLGASTNALGRSTVAPSPMPPMSVASSSRNVMEPAQRSLQGSGLRPPVSTSTRNPAPPATRPIAKSCSLTAESSLTSVDPAPAPILATSRTTSAVSHPPVRPASRVGPIARPESAASSASSNASVRARPVSTISRPTGSVAVRRTMPTTTASFTTSSRSALGPRAASPQKTSALRPSSSLPSRIGKPAVPSHLPVSKSALPPSRSSSFVPRQPTSTTVMMSRVVPASSNPAGPSSYSLPGRTIAPSAHSGPMRAGGRVDSKSPVKRPGAATSSVSNQPTRMITPPISSVETPSETSPSTQTAVASPPTPPKGHYSNADATPAGPSIPRSTTPEGSPTGPSVNNQHVQMYSPGPVSATAGRTPSVRKEKAFLVSSDLQPVETLSPEPEAMDVDSPATSATAPRAHTTPLDSQETSANRPKRVASKANEGSAARPGVGVRGRSLGNSTATSAAGPSRGRSAPPGTGPSYPISDKDLSALTKLHTNRNEVYFSAINRTVVRREGARPPSPTGKVRTVAEREEEERKLGREARAKRRDRRKSDEGTSFDGSDDGSSRPDVDSSTTPPQPTKHRRGPGDEEDYETPARPAKKARRSQSVGGVKRKRSRTNIDTSAGAAEAGSDKSVRWDKGLILLGAERMLDRDSDGSASNDSGNHRRDWDLKTCLKDKEKIQLDHLGNVPHAQQPLPDLKRTRINVAVVLYDGEEPTVPIVAPPPVASTSKKGKK